MGAHEELALRLQAAWLEALPDLRLFFLACSHLGGLLEGWAPSPCPDTQAPEGCSSYNPRGVLPKCSWPECQGSLGTSFSPACQLLITLGFSPPMFPWSFIHSVNVCPSLQLLQLWMSGPCRFGGGVASGTRASPACRAPCVSASRSQGRRLRRNALGGDTQ